MPLVRIDFAAGRPPGFGRALGDIVYRAMNEVIAVPQNDKFQIITEHPAGALNHADSYLGMQYSPQIVFIQITLSAGRSVDLKKALYQRIAGDRHAGLGVRQQDVFINLVEVASENWSFGGGLAQYA
jgi:hypothetical protein